VEKMFKLLRKLLTVGIIGGIIFVGIGDKFLPKPLSTYSLNSRNMINAKLITLIPKPTPKVKGFTEKREKQIENLK
jgi:hypothetical protein